MDNYNENDWFSEEITVSEPIELEAERLDFRRWRLKNEKLNKYVTRKDGYFVIDSEGRWLEYMELQNKNIWAGFGVKHWYSLRTKGGTVIATIETNHGIEAKKRRKYTTPGTSSAIKNLWDDIAECQMTSEVSWF